MILTFQNANYKLTDEIGNAVLLSVNYSQRSFKIKKVKQTSDISILESEASELAQDLINRKSNVNFAK